MINSEDRSALIEDVIQTTINTVNSNLRVSIPCIIQSFDAEKQTCVAQPAIKGSITNYDGSISSVNYPLLVDVPVQFPSAGGITITFPVKEGDECLVTFSDRCIDFWWQNGGIQESVDPRKHHLADGIAILGIKSVPNVISGISCDSIQIRSDDGSSFIELNSSSKEIKVKTPTIFKVDAKSIVMNAIQGIELTAPIVTINGLLQLNGGIVQGTTGGAPQTAKFNGSIDATGDIKSGSVSLKNHKHPYNGGATGEPI